jgi:hypothetical protein
MMKKLDSIKFKSEIVLERSITPTAERMGEHESTMTLHRVDADQYLIEWENPVQYVEIGIWTKGKKVTDYDGVFELPKQALTLLKRNGFNTKEVE